MSSKPDTTQISRYAYAVKPRRYVELSSGRYVAAKAVRSAADDIIDTQTVKIKEIASKYVAGSINLAEWQLQTAAIVKSTHVAMALAANGGYANTSNADLGFIAGKVKEQYKYLRDFALQIKKGQQPLDGTLASRSALYIQSARGTYEAVVSRAASNGGATQEKSMLGPSDHCSDCIGEATKGWSPIDSLIPIGERICKANCRCSFSYK